MNVVGKKRGPAPRPVYGAINMCCLAIDFHRWDCKKVIPKERTGRGPFLPLTFDQSRKVIDA